MERHPSPRLKTIKPRAAPTDWQTKYTTQVPSKFILTEASNADARRRGDAGCHRTDNVAVRCARIGHRAARPALRARTP
jgi:hypothetical protein